MIVMSLAVGWDPFTSLYLTLNYYGSMIWPWPLVGPVKGIGMDIRSAAMAIDLDAVEGRPRGAFMVHFITNWHEPWLVTIIVTIRVYMLWVGPYG